MGRGLGKNMRRLLEFQSTLEREKGLPPSQWVARLEGGEATPVPVSHRNRGRRRRMAAIMVAGSKVLVTTTFMGAWQQNVLAHAKVIGVQQAHRYR